MYQISGCHRIGVSGGAVCRFSWKPGTNARPELLYTQIVYVPTIIAYQCLRILIPWPVRSGVRGEKQLSPVYISLLSTYSQQNWSLGRNLPGFIANTPTPNLLLCSNSCLAR